MKTCSKCGEVKELCKFNLHSSCKYGVRPNCKKCQNKADRDYLKNNKEKAKKWREVNKKRRVELSQGYRLRHPEKYKAGNKINKAVFMKKIIKPKFCSFCGKDGRIEGHHKDYSKPLEVIWLCQYCHSKEHRRIKSKVA